MAIDLSRYQLSAPWYQVAVPVWEQLLPQLQPRRILEIGSYEGASLCLLAEILAQADPMANLEIHAVDSWEGGIEHQVGGFAAANMTAVEARFHANMELLRRDSPLKVDLRIHKQRSIQALASLIAAGASGSFDFIYVDGSHQSTDVIADAVLAFELVRSGGVIGFDDYSWREGLASDVIRCPKLAIDAFVNIFHYRVVPLPGVPLYQFYVQKL